MVDNPPDELSSQKYYAEEPVEPAPPVNLDRWHTELRQAIIAMRREGMFSAIGWLIGGGGMSFWIVLQAVEHPQFLVILAGCAALFVMGCWLETRWIRGKLDNSDLVARFYNADEELAEIGVCFGIPKPDSEAATSIQPEKQARADIILVTDRLTRLLLPPTGDFLTRITNVLRIIIIVGILGYIGVGLLTHYLFHLPHPDDLTPLEYLGMSAGITLFAFLETRSHVWSREFCSALSRHFGPDLVYSQAELALGPREFANRLAAQATQVRTAAVLAILLICGLGVAFCVSGLIMQSAVAAILLITILGVLIAAIMELNLPAEELKAAIHRAQIPLKLLSLDFQGELFSEQARSIARIVGGQYPEGSITRTALLVALDLAEYMRVPRLESMCSQVLAGAAFFGGGTLLIYLLAVQESLGNLLLLTPVPLALLCYWVLHRVITRARTMAAMLDCLQEQLKSD